MATRIQNNIARIQSFLKTDRAILITCISIAFVFWLFTKMSEKYDTVVSVAVNYIVPEDKVIKEPPPTIVKAQLTAGGWDLFLRYLRGRKIAVSIPLNRNTSQIISPRDQEIYIADVLRPEFKVESKSLQNIAITLDDKMVKSVPLLLNQAVTLASQYQLVDTIAIQPDSVQITGPASLIQDIATWETTTLTMSDVDASQSVSVPVKTHENTQISFDPLQVNCQIDVEQFTEKVIEIPIEIVHAPDSLNIILFKKRVTLSCVVGLSKYEEVDEKDFPIVFDLNDFDYVNSTFGPVKLKSYPIFVKNVRYSPEEIEFYVSKKLE